MNGDMWCISDKIAFGENKAHEKSKRSLIFTEEAVFSSTVPICSATLMNRLLKISNITGSTLVPIALALFIFFSPL